MTVLNDQLYLMLILVASFLLGSIPWGLVISRIFYRIDIREHGSGNIGTTNAMRSLGKGGGIAVFVLDFGKGLLSGVVAVFIYTRFFPWDGGMLISGTLTPPAELHAAIATALAGCTLGHVFSPWLKFRGGKGIAVAVGCLFVTFGWLGAVIELLVFIILVVVTRFVSVGSIAAAVVCPLLALWMFWGSTYAVVACAVVGLVVIWAHRGNIKRLLGGTEPRIGSKQQTDAE
jgi:glycerol-3-phosphate acyltransferase PlsY